ncbi:flagellar hook-length control protein FliK [Blastococcus sp. CT_GayMR19]|uniref:flagellar hook-length control protein FliK n=1 Tax=Blastococcus sp. CT_GayMR19 TaxID=2559608 RepID=UPI0010747F93|nr:flagellar hook-length control protein FliK [Blastococcus sp. CT_GayMR19]TFV78540.1 flagellar hook-length control protein FliK [Blastococcus sp. CT_GayMR19]
MNAPVTATLPGVRPATPRSSENGGGHSAAPFASALDGALSENRASERGVERRSTPGDRADRADRADERAAPRDQRIEDRARAAGARADDRTARAEARAERATARTTRTAAEKGQRDVADADPGSRDGDATVPEEGAPAAEETTDPAGKSAEAPRGGLPALWALLMGGSLATAPVQDAAPDAGAPAAPLPGVAGIDPATAGGPASTATVPGILPGDAAAAAAPAVTGVAVLAQAVATTVPAPSAPAAEGLPAAFSAVLAEADAVVPTATNPQPGAPATAAAPVSALPVDLVLDATTAVGTTAPTEVPVVVPTPAPVTPDGEVASPTGSSSADAVVAPAGGTPGEALSADAGGAGQPGGDDSPPPAVGTPGQAAVAPVASGASATTAAVAAADGATGADANLPVGAQVARQVAVLSGGPDGDHSMTLVLTPDTLGEVQVQVTLSKGSIELALRGAHEHGRAALMDALPELRRELEAAGLNPSRVEVARDTGGSWLDRQPSPQQGFGERGGQHDRGENRSRPWGRPADIGGSGPSTNPNRSTSSGVDVLV